MYSVDASEKMDRRSLCNRLCTQAKHDCCVGKAGELDVNYYEDTYNDEPWGCTFGTGENNGTWTNYGDKVGTIMSSMVWMLYMFAMLTMTLLAKNNKLRPPVAMIFVTLASLALAAHGKTMLTDPGSIPQEAVPLPILFKRGVTTHAMCSHCQTYKPPHAHHCRICNRCISGMDHHCPWMNNCVGANNLSKHLQLCLFREFTFDCSNASLLFSEHFILFLCYTWTGCAYALLVFGINYFFCNSDECVFPDLIVLLVRVMTILCIMTMLFVSSMLLNVIYGIMTGIGTIDRLKKKASGTLYDAEDEPMPLKDIFGIQGYWTWFLPVDPVFQDYDTIMGYAIPDRLKRERDISV